MLVGGLIILERQDEDGLAAFPEFCFSRRRGDADIFTLLLLSEVFLSLLGVGDLDLRLMIEFCDREFFEKVDFLALGDLRRFLGGVGDLCRFLGGVGDLRLFLGGVGDRVLPRPFRGTRDTLLSLFRFLRVASLVGLESARPSLFFLSPLDSGSGSGDGVEERDDFVDAQDDDEEEEEADDDDDDDDDDEDDMAVRTVFSNSTRFLPVSSFIFLFSSRAPCNFPSTLFNRSSSTFSSRSFLSLFF